MMMFYNRVFGLSVSPSNLEGLKDAVKKLAHASFLLNAPNYHDFVNEIGCVYYLENGELKEECIASTSKLSEVELELPIEGKDIWGFFHVHPGNQLAEQSPWDEEELLEIADEMDHWVGSYIMGMDDDGNVVLSEDSYDPND